MNQLVLSLVAFQCHEPVSGVFGCLSNVMNQLVLPLVAFQCHEPVSVVFGCFPMS